MAKITRKIDFLYNNFPKKAISLRKCTKKKTPSAKKKSKIFFAPAALYRWTPPPPPCYRNFPQRSYCHTALIPKPAFGAFALWAPFGPFRRSLTLWAWG